MKKIRSSLYLIALIVGFLLSIACMQRMTEQRKFWHVTREILQSIYGTDVLSCHFSFSDPSQFQIWPSDLPCYEKETYLASSEKTKQYLNQLRQIDASLLSKKGKETYRILVDYLTEKQEGEVYSYFEEPFSPTSGIHSSLPVLLSEYEMKSKKDVESYLELLSCVPDYFESLLRYETDKAESGMFMASEDVDLVISQCDFMASEHGKELFTNCFSSNLSSKDFITEEERDSYLLQHEKLFDTLLAPSYEKVADQLLLLKEHGKEQKGLCQYERGKEYYAYRIKQQIGTKKEVSEIESLLIKRLKQLYEELAQSQAVDEEVREALEKKTDKLDLKESSLSLLENEMSKWFPSLGDSGQVIMKQIPDALLKYTAPAYYFVPRISICKPGNIQNIQNVIYVNPSTCEDGVNLFTTLAHEGYPGHMFQNMYFLSVHGVTKENVLRYCLDFPGYSEGWAMYVELMSYPYAKCLGDLDEKTLSLLRLSREIQLCMLCYLDIQIHDHGATMDEIARPLARIGIKEPDALHDVYSYLVNEPGTYLKYYVGYLELLECKRAYQIRHKQSDPDWEKSFHTFFLQHGPDSYTNIKRAIQDDSSDSSIMLSK